MNRRTLLVTAGWLGAAVLAVLVGLTGVRLIGAGLTTPESRPRSAAEVAGELRSLPSPSVSRTPSPTASQAVRSPRSRTFPTRGGTVVARCAADGPEIVTMSPAPGFAMHERERAEGEFRSSSDNHDRVKFRIACSAGTPSLQLRGD
ncbi:hypothetical protein COUCH_29460 [Couchioplanes caeruleus]|uniref:hypothetical protein n=1 Tax=Couchioplanes caeruleus TaxID=56438 RepID=UPI0020C146A6|nr:hypothetical protein [Couchioplanes caeruleus]UQU63120.1 hypothetical protein COUCH_29460 [Couchioplanes caeruleus]